MSRPRGLRVIAGRARGRRLVAPEGDRVRPTKDMAREAMFAALDARGVLAGASVLDLYAGTGALAIEAVSRGAARAVVVERDRAALGAIRANVQVLPDPRVVEVVARDVARFLEGAPPAGAPFDLVTMDPPYGTADAEVAERLAALVRPGWLAPGAVVAVERPLRRPVVAPAGSSTLWERAFGDTLLTFVVLGPPRSR